MKKVVISILVVFIIIILIFIIGYYKFAKPVYDEDKSLGYNQFETVRIDPMTGEKIPKNEIDTYSNDNVELKIKDGTTITFKEIKDIRDKIKSKINNVGKIDDTQEIRQLCDILFLDYLNTNYKIEDGDLYINDLIVVSDIDFTSKVNELVQNVYKEQKGE